MQMFKRKYRRDSVQLSLEASQALKRYQWPGNVRELSHCIERAVLVCAEDNILAHDLGLADSSEISGFEDMTLAQAEQTLIEKALTRFNGNVSKAAELLGLSRHALHRRMEKYTIKNTEEIES